MESKTGMRHEVQESKTYTSAAKLIADLLDDPSIELEVEEKLARRKMINELVAERAKANLTVREVAKRMGVSVWQVRFIEESLEDSDLISFPMMRDAYVNAIRTKKDGGEK